MELAQDHIGPIGEYHAGHLLSQRHRIRRRPHRPSLHNTLAIEAGHETVKLERTVFEVTRVTGQGNRTIPFQVSQEGALLGVVRGEAIGTLIH